MSVNYSISPKRHHPKDTWVLTSPQLRFSFWQAVRDATRCSPRWLNVWRSPPPQFLLFNPEYHHHESTCFCTRRSGQHTANEDLENAWWLDPITHRLDSSFPLWPHAVMRRVKMLLRRGKTRKEKKRKKLRRVFSITALKTKLKELLIRGYHWPRGSKRVFSAAYIPVDWTDVSVVARTTPDIDGEAIITTIINTLPLAA